MSKQRIIVVLGMHRSGTSALTRGLQALQVGLGDQLNPANFANPKGYWEDEDVMRLNESILAASHSSYHHFGLFSPSTLSPETFEDLKTRAVELLHSKLAESGIWAFKDPRTSRLLPLWQAAFREIDCDPSYVISVRNPISVAHSLSKRDHFDPIKSYYLWLEHLLGALVGTKNTARVVVDYDLLLENPALQLSRISNAIHLPISDSDAVRKYEEEFLERDLRHAQHTLDDLARNADVPATVVTFYRLLQAFATDKMNLADAAAETIVEQVWKEWQIAQPALRLINRQGGGEQAQYEVALTKAHAKLAVLLGNVHELERQNEDLRSHCAKYQQHVDHLDNIISQLNEKVANLGSANGRAEAEASELRQQLDAMLNSRMWRVAQYVRRMVGAR